jgi:hypothetical protein
MTNIRFIQFPHPGREHCPSRDGNAKPWNTLKKPSGSYNSHARSFFQANGLRLDDNGPVAGPLWACENTGNKRGHSSGGSTGLKRGHSC